METMTEFAKALNNIITNYCYDNKILSTDASVKVLSYPIGKDGEFTLIKVNGIDIGSLTIINNSIIHTTYKADPDITNSKDIPDAEVQN